MAQRRIVTAIPGSTALFVCDIQERFRGAISNFDVVINTAARMIKAAGILQVPVVVAEHVPKVFQHTVPELLEPFSALPDALKHGPFPKTKFGMGIPEIEALVEEKGIQSVVLCGIESHICVAQTALRLLSLGKDVHILSDGVSSVNALEIPIALARLRSAGAQITTSESYLYELVGDASDPKFKVFAALMKEEKTEIARGLKVLAGNSTL